MRKRTAAVSLALLGPALLVPGCGNNSNETGNQANNRTSSGYRGGGGFIGRGVRGMAGSDNNSYTPRGGFGSTGRGFSAGS